MTDNAKKKLAKYALGWLGCNTLVGLGRAKTDALRFNHRRMEYQICCNSGSLECSLLNCLSTTRILSMHEPAFRPIPSRLLNLTLHTAFDLEHIRDCLFIVAVPILSRTALETQYSCSLRRKKTVIFP